MPQANYTFVIPYSESESGDYYWGFSEPEENSNTGLEPQDTRLIPSVLSVHTFFTAAEKGTFLQSFHKQVILRAKEGGYTLKDEPAVGNLVARTHENGKMVRYYETWVPICTEGISTNK